MSNQETKRKLNIGITLLIITSLSKSFLAFAALPCFTYTQAGLLAADCRNQNFDRIPQNLPVAISALYMDGNNRLKLDENSFANYQNLQIIHLKNLKLANPLNFTVHPKTFSQLNKLTILDLQKAGLSDEDRFIVPANLEIFIVADNDYAGFDLSGSNKLTYVNANDNRFTNIPKFALAVPLISLRMEGMSLDFLTVNDLAPLCNLKEFSVRLPETSLLRRNESYCKCQLIVQWLKTYDISGSIKCYPSSNAKCNTTFDESLLAKRYECLGFTAHLWRSIRKKLSNIIIIAVVTILVLVMILRLCVYPTTRRNKNERGEHHEEHHEEHTEHGEHDEEDLAATHDEEHHE